MYGALSKCARNNALVLKSEITLASFAVSWYRVDHLLVNKLMLISHLKQGGVKMDFGGTPGSKYDFARIASSFFYS